jgi:hypothetical protein
MSSTKSHEADTNGTKPISCSSSLLREIHVPYFRTPERSAALRAKLRLWEGSRWGHAGTRPNEMQCGITGDCLFWIHVFKAIGALPPSLQIPDYRKREAALDNMARLRSCIEATGRGVMVWSDGRARPPGAPNADGRPGGPSLPDFLPGDVLLFANGMSGVHCGLIVREIPPHFVHLSQNGLAEEPLNQAHWLKDLAFVYRLVESAGSATVPVADVPAKMLASETLALPAPEDR